MKKAEEAALKAYPPTYSEGNRYPKRVQSTLVDTHQPLRTIFQRAYEQAEKDTIERTVTWFKQNWREYVWTTDNGIPHFGHWENDFRKAMEEE